MWLIDAEHLKRWILSRWEKTAPTSPYPLRAIEIIDQIDREDTIDAVPVVRCKDCKWWEQIDNGPYGYCHACKHSFYSSNWEISIYRRYKEDWFCADGERKEDST